MLSEQQILNINIDIDSANELILRMKKGIRDVLPRLERLEKNGFYIETIMVNGQLVEHAIKSVIIACKLKRSISGHLDLPDPYSKIRSTRKGQKLFEKDMNNFNRKELGKIIGLFRELTKNKEMADKLEKFNTFRIEFIHHVFNGNSDLDVMDKKAKEYITNPDFKQMVVNIALIHRQIQKEIQDLHLPHQS